MTSLKEDISRLLNAHSGLSFNVDRGIVSGIVNIVSRVKPEMGVLDSYYIEIHLSKYYPFVLFPKVFETKGKIPREPDRHINKDGSFCLAVRPEEFRICKSGINLIQFIDDIVVPFLAVQSALTEGYLNEFPQGEFGHGAKGLVEFYQDRFKLEDPKIMLIGIELVLKNNVTRNAKCFCRGGKKTKRCHLNVLSDLKRYPKDFLIEEFELMKSSVSGKRSKAL